MSALTGKAIATTYKDILQMSGGLNEGITASLKSLEDGAGDTSPISISTDEVRIDSFNFNNERLTHESGGTLQIGNDITCEGAVFAGIVTINDDFTVAASSYFSSIQANNINVDNDLTVDGSGDFGNIDVQGALDITGPTTLQATLQVDGTSAFGAGVECQSSLNVLGAFTSGGTIIGPTGDLTVLTDLTVVGDSDLQSDVDVGGVLTVTGNTVLGGTVTTAGVATFNGDVHMNSNIYLSGLISSHLRPSTAYMDIGQAAQPWRYLYSQNVYNAGNIFTIGLTATGPVAFTSTTAIPYDVQIDGDVNIDGVLTMGANLVNIDGLGNAIFDGYGIFGTYVTVGSYLTVGTTFTAGTTGDFGSHVGVGGKLTVTDDIQTTAGDLLVDGDADIDGSSNFEGLITIQTGIRPATGISGGSNYLGNASYPFESIYVGNMFVAVGKPNDINTSSGNLTLTSATGSVEVDASLKLSSALGEHTINGVWIGNHIPKTDSLHTLGSATKNWKELHIGTTLAALELSSPGGNPTIESNDSITLLAPSVDITAVANLIITTGDILIPQPLDMDIPESQAVSFKIYDATSVDDYLTFDTLNKKMIFGEDVDIIGDVSFVGGTTITGDVNQTGNYSIDGDVLMENLHKIQFTNSGVNSYITSDGAGSAFYMSTNGTLSAVGTLLLSAPATTASGSLNVQGATDLDTTLNVDNIGTFQSYTDYHNDMRFLENDVRVSWQAIPLGGYPAYILAETTQATPEAGGKLELSSPVRIHHAAPKHHFNTPDLWGTHGVFMDQYSVRLRVLEGVDEITGADDGSFMHLAVESEIDDWQHYVWAGATKEGSNHLYS